MIKNKMFSLIWILLVLLAVFISGIWLLFAGNSAIVQMFSSCLNWFAALNWVYDYQVLIASIIALLSAAWAGRVILEKIEQQIRNLQHLTDGKKAAAKATLPFAISIIGSYIDSSTIFLFSILQKSFEEQDDEATLLQKAPEIDAGIFQVLKENVEFDADNRLFFSDLIATWQIQHHRISSLYSELGTTDRTLLKVKTEQYLVDTAELFAQRTALLEYVRQDGSGNIRNLKNYDISNALISMLAEKDLDLGLELSSNSKLAGGDEWQPGFRKFPK